MKTTLRIAALAGVLALSDVALADPSGTWLTENGRSRIRIADCGGALCGTIVWLKEPNGANKWSGQVYNAEDGKTYSGNIIEQGPNGLKLEGCALGGLVCKGQTWTRAN